uniref:AlNc14C8G1033 protein n=1 Tax=Albugo laibachii Nc14 TaxID=890382 RepID=F0W1V4_9STRA|nr:AlNc14C8G1033 [Albugo laibachii Nc14]|eukprot:CCA15033.1 AlNc14C8G1033 [Albugo laibachii Nc14]
MYEALEVVDDKTSAEISSIRRAKNAKMRPLDHTLVSLSDTCTYFMDPFEYSRRA